MFKQVTQLKAFTGNICNMKIINKIASGDDRQHSYGCLMLKIDVPNWDEILNSISKEDIYQQEQGYGFQKNPHVTIFYGLHDDQIDQQKLIKDVKQAIKNPINVTLKQINLFSNQQNPYDVVKFQVESKELNKLNKLFSQYKNSNKFPKYSAHMTIAYVKSGKGKKYQKKIKPIELTGKQIQYSMADGERKIFKSAKNIFKLIK